MNSTDKAIVLEKISHAHLLAHTFSENNFNDFISKNHLKLNSFTTHSYLLNVLYQLDDNGMMTPERLRVICDFLHLGQMDFDSLVRIITNRATGNHIPLTLAETKAVLRSILFVCQYNIINFDSLANFGEITKTLQTVANIKSN